MATLAQSCLGCPPDGLKDAATGLQNPAFPKPAITIGGPTGTVHGVASAFTLSVGALASQIGAADQFKVDWGDGTSTSVVSATGAAAPATVPATHTYAAAGTFTVSVTYLRNTVPILGPTTKTVTIT